VSCNVKNLVKVRARFNETQSAVRSCRNARQLDDIVSWSAEVNVIGVMDGGELGASFYLSIIE